LAIGPFPVNKLTNVSYLRRRDRLRLRWAASSREKGLFETAEIITSGLLADQATYAAVGSYDESLFIDFVDHEWCWRLRRKGGHVYVDLNTQLPHMVGNGEVPFTMGMKNSAPRRAYYIFRNGLGLIMSGRMPWYDAVKFLALIPVKFLVFSLMSQRTERWRFACQGIRDALR
jgi:rhamnosyltransferase